MDFTQGDAFSTDLATGNRMHQDTAAVTTEFSAQDANGVIWELLSLIVGSGQTPIPFDKTNPGSYTQVLQAVQQISSSATGIKKYTTGQALPVANIGPIWHDDYNSIMTWQAFTANGAAYTGYASLLVGGLLMDTQPTARQGYVKSGVSNLSRTTYAALRNWGLHHGVLVASGVWAAGAFAFKDNVDGTTFTVADVRGEFPRFWDDGRGIDAGRAFRSLQLDAFQGHRHAHQPNAVHNGTSVLSIIGSGQGNYQTETGDPVNDGVNGAPRSALETRPRNTALLASIKF